MTNAIQKKEMPAHFYEILNNFNNSPKELRDEIEESLNTPKRSNNFDDISCDDIFNRTEKFNDFMGKNHA